jgi:hypothetical protein
MAQNRESYYSLRVEIDGAKECKAVAAQIDEVIAEMAEAAWDAEIAEGETLYTADESADRDADAAGGHVKILSTELDGLCRNLRTIGKSRFKLTDPVLSKQFQDVPAAAHTVDAMLVRAKKLDGQWGRVPTPETWEPIPDLTRTIFQAKITALEAAFADAQDKEKAAQPLHANAKAKAARIHQHRVAFRTEGLASFPKGSAKWELFNHLPPVTPRRKRQSGEEGEGDGEPEAPTG